MLSPNSKITNDVQEMYMQYPFPDIDYQIDYGLSILRFLSGLRKRREDFWLGAKVLEAGCGTGNTLGQLAKHFRQAHFLGVDFSQNSLEKAKRKSEALNLKNIEFKKANILELDLAEKPFDVVLCIGVLHHLADMQKGLERLVAHLAEDGVMLLWLYGKYGRFRLNLNQRFFSILCHNVPNLRDRVDIAEKVLTKADEKYVSCHFNVPYSEIEDDFPRSLEFIREHPQWLVDQFLHINELVVDMEDILRLAGNSGLRLLDWLNVSQDITAYVDDPEVARAFSELDHREKLLCLDLLLKPNYYTIALEKA